MTRKLMVSIMAIALAVVALGASTYAWFTLTKVNSVGQISMTVKGDVGLEISLDGINWYNELTSEILEEFLFDETTGVAHGLKLIDVTSVDGVTFQGGGVNTVTPTANVDYLAFNIYFRALTSDGNVYLFDEQTETADTRGSFYRTGSTGTWISSQGVAWTPDATFTYDADAGGTNPVTAAAGNYYAADAVRISFLDRVVPADQFVAAAGDDNPAHLTPIALPTTGSAKVFDLSVNPARGYGYLYGAREYFYVKNGKYPDSAPALTATAYDSLSTLNASDQAIITTANSMVATLTRQNVQNGTADQYIGATTLFMWLEGHDADCFDAIFKDKIKVQLSFKQAVAAA